MQELITITTGGQGSPVVSARELHRFLEVKTKFADWIKSRIIKYRFQEDTDYVEVVGFSENSEKGGRPELDYALTLDMAKELAMVERNDKGKEARLYFIEKEKQLNALAPAPPSMTEQVLLQLVGQQTQLIQVLSQLRSDVDSLKHTQRQPTKPGRAGKQLSLPGLPPSRRISSGPSLRQLINQRINEYCHYHCVQAQETYIYLYKRMYDVYGIAVYHLRGGTNDNIMDLIERHGHLDRFYSLVMAELNYTEE